MSTRMAGFFALLATTISCVSSSHSREGIHARTSQNAQRVIQRLPPVPEEIRTALAGGTRDSTGRPRAGHRQLWTEYTIHATLDPGTSKVIGRQTVTVQNLSEQTLHEIVLRLDQNLFSTLNPSRPVGVDSTEGMRIRTLSVDGSVVDLLSRPNEGSSGRPRLLGSNLTSSRLILSRPVVPRSSVRLDIEWDFQVPRNGIRMGRRDDSVYQIGQWYPRVAMFDDLRKGGWDTDPYSESREFHNNFGRFDVRIEVPQGWLVGATGVLRNGRDVLDAAAYDRLARSSDTIEQRRITSAAELPRSPRGSVPPYVVWHFVADTASDFAWAASNKYVWDVAQALLADRRSIPIHLFYVPGSTAYANAGAIARNALELYSDLFAPYPFPQLTVSEGPEGGMEYPMFVMSEPGRIAHEIGHQWWPMTVGVNETRFPFMDEGLVAYMSGIAADASEGRSLSRDGIGQRYGARSGATETPLLGLGDYSDETPLTIAAYSRPSAMLSMLGGMVGDEAVWRALGAYAKAWRFQHPSPWDFMFFMSNALGQDLGWFWYYWLFASASVDGAIQAVRAGGDRLSITVRQNGEMPSPVILQVRFNASGAPIRLVPNARMLDSVTALVSLPVDVWFNGSRTITTDLDFGSRAVSEVILDPSRRFPDKNPSDNVWRRNVR